MSTAKLRLLFLDDDESPMLKWFPGPRTAQKSGVWPLMSTSRCGPISSFFSQKTGLLFWPKMSFFLATARTRPFSQNVLLAPPKLSSFFSLFSTENLFLPGKFSSLLSLSASNDLSTRSTIELSGNKQGARISAMLKKKVAIRKRCSE